MRNRDRPSGVGVVRNSAHFKRTLLGWPFSRREAIIGLAQRGGRQTAPQPLENRASWWLLAAVLALYILPGLIGHDPWKPDEGYVFDIVYHIIRTDEWVVPRLAGQPFMEKPPMYYLVAAGFARLLSPWLPLHDGARCASGLFIGLSLLWTALTARKVWGPRAGGLAALALAGCLGLIQPAHFMVVDVALLCGFTLALYGLACYVDRGIHAGWIFGTGVGMGFLAKGLLAPGVLGITALLLPVTTPHCRNRAYVGFLCTAVIAASPWLFVWPILLYHDSPDLFMRWFWANNFGRLTGSSGLGGSQPRAYYATVLPWFTWPAWPFAAVALWRRSRDILTRPGVQALCIAFIVLLCVLSASATARALYALPLLPPLAVLAAGTTGDASHRLDQVIYGLGVVMFGALIVALWAIWIQMLRTGHMPLPSLVRGRLTVDFRFRPSVWALGAATLATTGWPVLLWAARGTTERAWIGWLCGLAVAWCLLNTLYLPWFNQAMSYRDVFASMGRALPARHGCIAGQSLKETQRGMLDYFEGIDTVPVGSPAARTCKWLLIQSRQLTRPGTPGWQLIWSGHRPADRDENYQLLVRHGPTAAG